MSLTIRPNGHLLLLACSLLAWGGNRAGAQSLTVSTLAGGGTQGDLNGSGGAARFFNPSGVSVDSLGNLYVADTSNHTIRKVTPAGIVTTFAGTPTVSGGIDGPAGAAAFNNPIGTAVDAAGNVYVADRGNSAIRIIPVDGIVGTFAGHLGASGDVDGVGDDARFSFGLAGIAIDRLGNLYVSDGACIRKITPERIVSTLAGVQDSPGSVDGMGNAARFRLPEGLAVDARGNVYVADGGDNAIRMITPAGQVTTVAGVPGVLGSADGSALTSQFREPDGIAIDGVGNLYVADTGNQLIREVSRSGRVLTIAGGFLSAGSADGTGPSASFNDPAGIVVDAGGNIYIADAGNSEIRRGVTLAPLIGLGLAPVRADPGVQVTLAVSAGGLSPLSYQWSFNGVPITGATAATYVTHPIRLSDAGIYSVAVSNSLGTAVSEAPLNVSFIHDATVSFDGWTSSSPLPGATSYSSVAYDGSRFVAVGLDGTAFTSADGLGWTPSASNGAPGQTWGELNSIINVPGRNMLVAAGNGGAIVTFAGGTYNGTLRASGSTAILTGVAVGNGSLVAVGYGGASVHSDLTAAAWAPSNTGVTGNLNAIAFGNGKFVAVGLAGLVVTSPDGVTWTTAQLGATPDLYGIAYGARGFVAVGSSGAILLSPDGTSWFTEPSPTTNLLVHIGYGDGTYVAIGFLGTVLTSADEGLTWSPQNSGTQQRLDGVTFGSDSFVLTGGAGVVVASSAADPSRLVNLSARSSIDATNILIAGFVLEGSGTKNILLRGVGPTLLQFGIANALAQPSLTLFSGQSVVESDLAWGGGANLAQAFTQVGAFPLAATSADSAFLSPSPAGAYTVQLKGLNGTTGVGLAEIYDADAGPSTARLANISARALVGVQGNILIAGFVIAGNTPETVLIRGIGPSLTQFGVASAISTPQLALYDTGNNVLEANTGWAGSAPLAAAFAQVGAFSLTPGSVDAAMLVTLPPGAYTAEMSGVNGATGLGLVEIYEVR